MTCLHRAIQYYLGFFLFICELSFSMCPDEMVTLRLTYDYMHCGSSITSVKTEGSQVTFLSMREKLMHASYSPMGPVHTKSGSQMVYMCANPKDEITVRSKFVNSDYVHRFEKTISVMDDLLKGIDIIISPHEESPTNLRTKVLLKEELIKMVSTDE